MSARDKAINWGSMIAGGLLGLGIGVYVYKRTMARAAELAREEAATIAADAGEDGGVVAPGGGYADAEEAPLIMGDEDAEDAAALMDDDDMSLWTNEGVEAEEEAYRDSVEGDGKVNGNGNGRERGLDEEAAIEGNGIRDGAKR